MFTRRYFAGRYFAPRYFPGIGAAIVAVIASYIFFFSPAYRSKRKMITLLPPKAVTPSDVLSTNAVLATLEQPDQLWVGVSGDVTVILIDGTTFLYPAVAAGGWHDMPFFKGVKATGTTATGIKVTRKRKIQ